VSQCATGMATGLPPVFAMRRFCKKWPGATNLSPMRSTLNGVRRLVRFQSGAPVKPGVAPTVAAPAPTPPPPEPVYRTICT